MKKKSIVSLIRCYAEHNDIGFKNEAFDIAREFENSGDQEIAEYIMSLLNDANSFVPQIDDNKSMYFEKVEIYNYSLPLPKVIMNDVIGIINAVSKKMDVNKFLFEGKPGTGKTETAKHIARLLNRDLYEVNFDSLIDFKLGETSKNITEMFDEISKVRNPSKVIFLFDELDALAINRVKDNDLREMGRATSSFIKGLDKVGKDITIIATTNLYKDFDKAIIRRFDTIIDFDRYSNEDLIEISNNILNDYIEKNKDLNKNSRLFNKIISLMNPIPMPGELKNLIKTAVAFSNKNNANDYLIRLFKTATKNKEMKIKDYQGLGFSLRDIEVLTGVSKSTLSREQRGK